MNVKEYTNQLQNFGYRLTTPRTEILKVLSTTKPLSTKEVFAFLKKNGSQVDIVTTYRTLELFEKLGFIRKIQLEDKTSRYELIGASHHHHLVCMKCKNIEDVQVEEGLLLNQIKKQSRFRVEKHALEFFGICGNCQRL
ncbi:transcriptional repressor [Candidatus Gottesmanbacteria bacterium]|nr:transcriptional repressor [Candidatus Gottesmanbacteria bacterium]